MPDDVPVPLIFVDPDTTESTYRVALWAAPGQGKSCAAASAPAPILVLSADRPSAYRFARKLYAGKDIREVRYRDVSTLEAVYDYLRSEEGAAIRTVVLDPVSSIYDQLVDTAPIRSDGDPDYQKVNKKLLGFVQALRAFDLNVVLVAHEKLSDGKKGDGKLYPALGGPSLINKLLAEMDVVAHIERRPPADGDDKPRWVGQLQPRDNLVCKESTGVLGDVRIADLTRWFEVATAGLAPSASDLPWNHDFEPPAEAAAPTAGEGPRTAAEPPPTSASPPPQPAEASGPGAGTAKEGDDPEAVATAEAEPTHASDPDASAPGDAPSAADKADPDLAAAFRGAPPEPEAADPPDLEADEECPECGRPWSDHDLADTCLEAAAAAPGVGG